MADEKSKIRNFQPIDLKAEDNGFSKIWNPLRFLTEEQVAVMIDAARGGRISQLQVLYRFVEASDLTTSMVLQRREAALPDWTIRRRETRKFRSFDEKLADEEQAFLTDQFVRCEDSGTLLKALDTLHKAVFRGLGVVEPIYDAFGLQKIISLDNWNFAVDYSKHDELGNYPLFWNPSGSDIADFANKLERIPDEQIVAAYYPNPIDNFALQIFVASNMGLDAYEKLISRRGLPATYIIAPEDLPAENLEGWAHKAIDVARGGSGAFPFGTNIITANLDTNSATAIQAFLEYLSKQIVLAATGGTLASLTAPTGLGSNVADVQNDVFKSIVRKDASKIGDLINRGIAKRLLNLAFPGRDHLVFFDLADEQKQTPDKYLDDAIKAKNAGYQIDLNQIQELTGYTLTKVEEPKADSSIWDVPRGLNADKPKVEVEAETIVENSADDTEAVEAVEEKITKPNESEVKHGVGILKAFDSMLAPLRRLIEKLFTAKSKAESDSIMADINEEVNRLESADDSELAKAVETLLIDAFEDVPESEKKEKE